MTCQDCSPYMRSEETVLHRATAHGRLSVLCMPLSGAGTVHESIMEAVVWLSASRCISTCNTTTAVEILSSSQVSLLMQLLEKQCWKVFPFSIVLQGVGVFVHRFHCLLRCGHLLAVRSGDVRPAIYSLRSNTALMAERFCRTYAGAGRLLRRRAFSTTTHVGSCFAAGLCLCCVHTALKMTT